MKLSVFWKNRTCNTFGITQECSFTDFQSIPRSQGYLKTSRKKYLTTNFVELLIWWKTSFYNTFRLTRGVSSPFSSVPEHTGFIKNINEKRTHHQFCGIINFMENQPFKNIHSNSRCFFFVFRWSWRYRVIQKLSTKKCITTDPAKKLISWNTSFHKTFALI